VAREPQQAPPPPPPKPLNFDPLNTALQSIAQLFQAAPPAAPVQISLARPTSMMPTLPTLRRPTSVPVAASGLSFGQVALIGLGVTTVTTALYLLMRGPAPQEYGYGPPPQYGYGPPPQAYGPPQQYRQNKLRRTDGRR